MKTAFVPLKTTDQSEYDFTGNETEVVATKPSVELAVQENSDLPVDNSINSKLNESLTVEFNSTKFVDTYLNVLFLVAYVELKDGVISIYRNDTLFYKSEGGVTSYSDEEFNSYVLTIKNQMLNYIGLFLNDLESMAWIKARTMDLLNIASYTDTSLDSILD